MTAPLQIPATTAAHAAVTLRPVTEGDRFRLRRWLSEPHVIQWWGSKAAADASVAIAADSDTAVARIIDVGAETIGYAHALDLDDARLPPATWTADVFIGAAPYRGQGLGATALALLRDEVFASTLASALAVRVAIRNEAAVRAIERAGFTWHTVAPDRLLGPCWLLLAVRG